MADLVPHKESEPHRRRFIPVAQIAMGMDALPDWAVGRFTRELEELDTAVDDSDADRWHTAT